MTVEELLLALQAIIDEAAAAMPEDAPEDAEPELNADQLKRYEALELQLANRRKSDAAIERQRERGQVDRSRSIPAGGGRRSNADARRDTIERAFDAYVRTGQVNQDIAELRAQGEGTGSEGGYLVPTGWRDKLIERMVAFGGLARHAEEISTGNGNPLPWGTIDDTANLGEIVNEGGTFSSGADLVFGTAELSAYKYMAGGGSATPLRVSFELAQDAAFDIEGLINRKLGERIGRIQARHVVRGSGVKEPLGLITGRTGIEIATNTGVVYDDLVEFEHSIDPAYREAGTCKWAMNDNSIKTLKKLKDSHGDNLWRPADADMATGTGGGTLNGYEVVIDQAFPDIAPTDNTVNWGAFGDFSEGYVVRRVREVVLIVNPWTRASNGQIEYTAWARMDATQQNTSAYCVLTGQT